MPRFSINASVMLTEHELPDRFGVAADLGFGGVDLQFPYDHDPDLLAARAASAGVEVVLVNVPAGDLMQGGDGLACVPGREADFAAALARARDYASALGCKRVNVLSGRVPQGVAEAEARKVLVDNLRRAADFFAPEGVAVMMEPCNTRDVPRTLVSRTAQALEVLDEAGHDNLWLQFDFYHRQVMEGDLIEGFRAALKRIAHVQFADTPGRNQAGTGEIAYEQVFKAIDASGYQGWVGAEYRPSGAIEDSLGWMRR